MAVRVQGPSAAAALGASGVVIRSISTSDDRFPHTGAMRYTPDAPRIPAFAISNPDADALERQFASGKPVRLRMYSSSRDLPPARSANVVGEIPGTEHGDEIVILGAHLDSWDPGVGAIDDGAGVAIMMGVAKLIRGLDAKPRRTIRVVLFANEEFGTSGSQAYVAANQAEVARHVLGFEADFGAGPVWRLSSRVNPAQLPAVDQIYRALAPLKLARGGNEARGGADLDGLASSACRCSSAGSRWHEVLRRAPHGQRHDGAGGSRGVAPVGGGIRNQRLAGRAVSGHLGTRHCAQGTASLAARAASPLATQRRNRNRHWRQSAALLGLHLLESQARGGGHRIQDRVRGAARQAETMSALPGANPRLGRIGGGRQLRQLSPTPVVRMHLFHRKPGAVVRNQFAGNHRQHVFQSIAPG